MLNNKYRLICISTITVLVTSGSAIASFQDYAACFTKSLPDLVTRPKVRDLTMGFMDCAALDHLSLHEGAIAAKTKNHPRACSIYSDMDYGCKDFLIDCSAHQAECTTALDNALNCIPYANTVNSGLKSAGIDAADIFVQSLVDFQVIGEACIDGQEYVEPKPPLFWDQNCNDYATSPVSFYEINEYFYEYEDPVNRADLLNRFALSSPSGEKWQRIVATIMGIESMNSDFADERAAAAKALGIHGDYSTPVVTGLLTLLSDNNANVRAEAALALRNQGNRKSLVILSLLNKLLDQNDTPEVRANAALALREQAVNFVCESGVDKTYLAGGSEDSSSLLSGINICLGDTDNSREDAQNDYGGDEVFGDNLASSGSSRCVGSENNAFSIFDRYTSPEQIKTFDILENICYSDVQMRSIVADRISRSVLLQAIQVEGDVEALAKMVSSSRNLAVPQNNDDVLLTYIRFNLINHKDWRIRQASIYALGKAARDEPWFYNELIPKMLDDSSPSVRRAAIAALSERQPLSLGATPRYFTEYITGKLMHDSQAEDCENSKNAQFDGSGYSFEDRNAQNFAIAGFNTAYNMYQHGACEVGEAGAPVIKRISPEVGEKGVAANTAIELYLEGTVIEQRVLGNIYLEYRDEEIQLDLLEFNADEDSNTTYIKLKPKQNLSSANFYKLVVSSNFSERIDFDVWFLFMTESINSSEKVADLMESDKDIDVQYTAAESFIFNEESMVLNWLLSRMTMDPPRNTHRAATYMSIEELSYSDYITNEDNRRDFLKSTFKRVKEYVEEREKMQSSDVKTDDYLPTPAISQLYHFLHNILNRNFVTDNDILDLDANTNIRDWLLKKLLDDYPVRDEYTFYERIYYPSVRPIIKDLINRRFMDGFERVWTDVDYLIYQDGPDSFIMSEDD